MKKISKIKILLKYSAWLLILIVLSPNAIAQKKPVYFNHLSSSNGLSQNRIYGIVQDHEGFIWIGTEDGLNKYDGYNFEIFKRVPGDSLSLNDNQAQAIYVAKDGTLWAGGTLAGLSKYNSATKTFTRYQNDHSNPNTLAGNNITSFSEDNNGNLWIATQNNGFDYMLVREGKFIHMLNMLPQDYPLSKDQIYFIHQDRQNHLWIGSEGKIHYFKISYSGTGVPKLQPEKIEGQNIITSARAVKEDSERNIWIGTDGDGLLRFDYNNKVLKIFNPIDDGSHLKSISISALESDGNGNIWIGGSPPIDSKFYSIDESNPGLFKLNIKSRKIQQYQSDPKNEKSLSSNLILSLFIDKTGVLWVGTDLSGVNIYDKSVIKFSLLHTGPEESNRIKSAIRGFYLDKNNVLWIASSGSGLIAYNRSTDEYEFFKNNRNDPNTISNDIVHSIYDDGKYLWAGTVEGLNRFDKKRKIFKRYYIDSLNIDPANPASRVNTINYNIMEIDKLPGYLWFGTNGSGLVRFDKEKEKFKKYTYDPENENSLNNRANFVRTVWYSKSRPDELWTGTTNGINILNLKDETFRYYNYAPNDSASLSHPNVMHFYEDGKGYIWVATYGGGLNRLDPKTEKFLRFTEENSNLPNNGVYGTLPDENGNLWISTNNGITKFNPDTFQFRNYGVEDGLQSEEFNGGAYYEAPSGEMFFGGIKGFNFFFPSEVIDNKYIPNIVITGLKIFNEPIQVGEESPLKQQISKTKEIVLPYWQNDITFDYVGLHYKNPKKNKYAYKLEPYEKEWKYVEDVRNAHYTNLSAGKYTFYVKASNSDGVWNEEGKQLAIIINPPPWATWWAYAIYFFAFVGILGGIRKFELDRRKEKENKKLLQLENARKTKELEEARDLQLSMLPKALPRLPHLDIAVYMKTATEVGGDYYDFNVGLDGTLTVAIGDATGHGMKAGTIVSMTKALFASGGSKLDMKTYFNQSSDALKEIELGRLMMAFMMVKIKDNILQICNAGMPPLFIYRKQLNQVEEIMLKGMPLGAIKNFPYEIVETELSSGDTLLLLSDGLPELKNANEEQFGYNRVKESFKSVAKIKPEEIISHLKDQGSHWVNDKDPDDDVTFVVVKIK